jgi:hypothetical protein
VNARWFFSARPEKQKAQVGEACRTQRRQGGMKYGLRSIEPCQQIASANPSQRQFGNKTVTNWKRAGAVMIFPHFTRISTVRCGVLDLQSMSEVGTCGTVIRF